MSRGIENDTQKDDARDVSVVTATQAEGSKKRPKRIMKYVALSVSAIILLAVGVYGFFFLTTPSYIRTPAFQHYHFRTQLVVNDTPVDFSKDAFQGKKSTTIGCSAEVGSAPIDFHDNIDQMTHIHWDGMTGGEFLKYYGWNLIGGNDNSLGNRYDNGLIPSPVATYGNVLPELPANTNFYVYIGNADGYEKKEWKQFLREDFETFFGKKSNVGASDEVSFNPLDWLFPTAAAHGGVDDGHASDKTEEELTRINNLLGNVVIFVQQDEPSDKEITARFTNLIPLGESTCGD